MQLYCAVECTAVQCSSGAVDSACSGEVICSAVERVMQWCNGAVRAGVKWSSV